MHPQPPETLATIAHAAQQYAAYSVNGFVPEIILVVGFLLAILLDALTRKSRSKQFSIWFAIGVLAIAGIFAVLEWHGFDPSQPRDWKPGQLIFPYTQTLFAPTVHQGVLDSGYSMAVVDNFSVYFKLLVSLAGILVLLMSLDSRELRKHSHRLGEYASLILGMSIGLYLMPASTDLVMMYISLELVSIAGYILAGFSRETEHGAEASLKYILFGALSSGLMIYGFSLFYGLTGTTNLIAIRQVLALAPATHAGTNIYILWTATILALAGMGYKISAVPFHFWTPDVYEGAPLPVTALLSVASKAAGFGLLIRFVVFIFPSSATTGAPLIDWPMILAAGAVLTMTFGNLAALLQSNVRRMLAYSTIAHAGYMLAALAIGQIAGIVAVMIYLATYLFMQLGAFYGVMLIENKISSEAIEDYRGLVTRTPLVASALVIFLISLAGIPLTAGFIGKFYLLSALLTPDMATHSMPWLWLGIAVILNSLISLYYYLRVAGAMFLKRPLREMAFERIGEQAEPSRAIRYSIPARILLMVLLIPVVLLGVYFQPLVDFASGVIRFFNFQNFPY
ncbi:MAG TPA: NADH-quinone oxidoreductase subunit N [Candidatus Kapabacteria bacterium]|nr:NADH-quinone oxidoreductase subunit N [Candidatus Kapabacteria bacterium]